MPDPTPLAAQDAAEALIALGWPVVPFGPDMDRWQIGCLIWSDDELMARATRHGIRPVAGRVQPDLSAETASADMISIRI